MLKIIFISVILTSLLHANSKKKVNINELVLPSEVKELSKTTGAVYYSPAIKNKVLIPAHFWGDIQKNGLHFIPTDTSLVKGLSIAGGPSGSANLENVKVKRVNKSSNKLEEFSFDLSEGGDANAHDFNLKSGDTIFVEKSNYLSNRAWYTSLVGVGLSVISTFLILNEVDD